MSDTGSKALVCPQCKNAEGLEEIGEITTLQPVQFTRYADGEVNSAWENWRDCGDAPIGTGVQCRECGWEHLSDDYLDHLVAES